jgi:hypothetical protein
LQAHNLTAGQINIVNADEKKSSGMLYPAAQLVINQEGDLQIELRKNPWKLNSIILRGAVEKSYSDRVRAVEMGVSCRSFELKKAISFND